ncbi:MAG: hypothetical protein D6773_18050 [Alphaproteobacteria bacterium]|nr:MAG: hypothetical protein D6773_18050 [Alphaproteobacteria bacterium]
MRCGQILVEGRYRDFVQPNDHYIPLKPDFSNMGEVFAAMANRERVAQMIADAYDHLIASSRFRFSTHVREVMDYIKNALKKRAAIPEMSPKAFREALAAHHGELIAATLKTVAEQEALSGEALTSYVRPILEGQKISEEELDSHLANFSREEISGKFEEITAAERKTFWHYFR